MDGLRSSMYMGLQKLLNSGSLQRYKDKVNLTSLSNNNREIMEQNLASIKKWRLYLAKNFDKNPEFLLRDSVMEKLAHDLLTVNVLDPEKVAPILNKYKLDDNVAAAARLLCVYLNPDTSKLTSMEEITCHLCNKKGHVVRKLA